MLPGFRRVVAVLCLVVFVAASAVGCAKSPAKEPAGQQGEQLAQEQVLRILFVGKKASIAPNKEGGLGRTYITSVFLPPFLVDPDMKLVPGVCTDYEESPDGLTAVLHVDPKAVFSDGTPITASEIKQCWEFGARAENLPSWGGFMLGIPQYIVGMKDIQAGKATEAAGLVVRDERTLEVRFTQRVPGAQYGFASYGLGVYKAGQARADKNWEQHPVVSGPFLLSWDPETGKIELTPNDKFWREKPKLAKVLIEVVPDIQTQLVAYENGEADVLQITGLMKQELLAPQSKHRNEMIPIPNLGVFFYVFNTTKPPFDDVHVRRAFLMALDRKTMHDALFPAETLAQQLIPAGFKDYQDPGFEYPYDLEGARQELAQSKYARKLPSPITIYIPTGLVEWRRISTAVQEQWQKAFGVRVEVVETDVWEDLEKGHIWRNSQGVMYPDPSQIISALTEPNSPVVGVVKHNIPEVAEARRRGDSASSLQERRAAYLELERLVRDNALYIPMYYAAYYWLVNPKVKGFETSANVDIYSLGRIYKLK